MRSLGDAYGKDAGRRPIPRSPRLARAFAAHRAGCDAGDSGACHMLSRAYDKGLGVARDEKLAQALEEKGCALGHVISPACSWGSTPGRPAVTRRVRRDARACELACLCDPLIQARGRGSPAAAEALASFRARCARGEAMACAAATRVEKAPLGLRPRASFTGNHALTGEELDAVVEIDKPDGPLARGDPRGEVLESDRLSLSAIYSDHGYLDVRVDAPVLSPAPEGTFLDVRFDVEEGPRYRVGKLTIAERNARGKVVSPLRGGDLRARIALRDGEWFSQGALIRELVALSTRYRDAGYAAVEANPISKQDASRAVVDIDVPVHRGPLVHVARVVVKGNGRGRSDMVRKEIRIAEGALQRDRDRRGRAAAPGARRLPPGGRVGGAK